MARPKKGNASRSERTRVRIPNLESPRTLWFYETVVKAFSDASLMTLPHDPDNLEARYHALAAELDRARPVPTPRTDVRSPRRPQARPMIHWKYVMAKWRMRQKRIATWTNAFRVAKAVAYTFGLFILLYELREWQDDRVTRAWQLVTTRAPGNSGKIQALEYLNSEVLCAPKGWSLPIIGHCWKERTPLTGIDLSKATNNGQVYLQGIDLSGADLSEANFSDANLFGANLSGGILHGSNLSGAVLKSTNLSDTTIARTDLSGANLYNANLSGADLKEVDLSNANLFGANLSNAVLDYVDLSKANFTETKLPNVDVMGLLKDPQTIFLSVWANEDAPPTPMSDELLNLIAIRKQGEKWNKFVDRIMRDRPELGWTEGMKNTPPVGD